MLARGRRALANGSAPTRLRLPRAVGLVALAAALAFLGRAAWRDAPALAALLGGLALPALLAALAATLAASALVVALWRGLLARLGICLAPAEATAVLSLSYLARYLPGAIWGFAAIGYLGRRRGVPYRAGAFSLGAAIALQALSAGLWVVPMLAGGLWPGLGRLWPPALALGGGAAVLLAPVALRRLAGPLGIARVPGTPPWWGRAAVLVIGWFGYWALAGAALALTLRALGTPTPPLPTLIGIAAAAWLGGLLGSAAPAGLGVQDAALALLLERVLPAEAALAATLLARGLKTANDLLYGLAGLLLYRRLGLGAAEEATDGMDNDPAGTG